MNIIKTNIKDNDWNMDLSYDMFQSPDRQGVKDYEGQQFHVDKYAVYEEENAKGNMIRLVTILTDEGFVMTTNSPSFIRTFSSIADLAENCSVRHYAFEVVVAKSKNNREFITAKYVKD